MRLLLPMAYTIVVVMKSVTHTDGKTAASKDNYSYRLLEVDIEPEKGGVYVRQPQKIRPFSNNDDKDDDDDDYDKNNKKTGNSYQQSIIPRRTHAHLLASEDDDNDESDNVGEKSGKVATTKTKKFNGHQSATRNDKKIVDIDIPDDFRKEISRLRIPRRVTKKKKTKSKSKRPQQEAQSDMDMDMNMELDMDVDVNAESGEQGNGDDDGNGNEEGEKSRKQYKNQKRKRNKTKKVNSDDNGVADDENSQDDENNHQEEEEEVEEKKEKVHKVTIKKKRPYLNETKSISESVLPAKHHSGGGGAPILHSHSHSHSPFPYQTIVEVASKPVRKKKINTDGGGTTTNMNLQNQFPNGIRQPGKMVTLLKPLRLQENAAANAINPNHLDENSTIRKGIKPRDVNLILRTKHSPRILIRRYKPLLGAYQMGIGLNLMKQQQQQQQQRKRLGLYHRPLKTRKKICRKCKKKKRKRPFYANKFPAFASDAETFHPYQPSNQINSNAMAPTTTTQCAHAGQSHGNVESPSPQHPWHGGTTSGASHYAPNTFEYADENLLSPRLPSQPVNAYLRVPAGSGRSSDDADDDADPNDHHRNQSELETSPLLLGGVDDVHPQSFGESKDQQRQQQQQPSSAQPPQRESSKKNAATTYLVHETDTEYEPDAGHKKVEQLAAIHQQEMDAGLLAAEQDDQPPLTLTYSHTFEDTDENNAPIPTADELQNEKDSEEKGRGEEGVGNVESEEEEKENENEEEEEEEEAAAVAAVQVHKQDPEEEDEADVEEEEKEEEEEVEGENEEQAQTRPQEEQEYIDEQNQSKSDKLQPDKLFDISNSDTWADDV